jgi:hypothetical protein
VTDPYLDGVYRWWHLSTPSPELVAAEADGWLGAPGAVVDIGCGLGTEIAYLAAKGCQAVGIDLSVRRVLQPGGCPLLRACLTSCGVQNEVTESGITTAFAGWATERLTAAEIPSDTRTIRGLVVRLRSSTS